MDTISTSLVLSRAITRHQINKDIFDNRNVLQLIGYMLH